MTGKHLLVVVVGLAAAIGAGAARAGTPFGGDDTGFVPPDLGTLKCESSVTKNAAKLTLAVSLCHIKAADAGVKGKTFDEDTCQSAARGKFDAANLKLTCPSCVDSKAIGDNVESMLDTAANAGIYCDTTSGTPFGGDDAGDVPASKAAEKCQNLTAKQLALLVGTVSKCHNKLAAQALKGKSFDEEVACENPAVSKFNAFTAKLTNCPSCLSALLAGLGQAVADGVDAQLGTIYCQSPSGAFLN
jgi:hypothetical protein